MRRRLQTEVTPRSLECTAPAVGWSRAVAFRLLFASVLGLMLFVDPLASLGNAVNWVVFGLGGAAMAGHALELALTRSRLFLDRETARFVLTGLLGVRRRYVCDLPGFRAVRVRRLRTEDGDEDGDAHCLELRFGAEAVEAFVAHDEDELRELQALVVDWLGGGSDELI
jgi:hypothetical protein